MKKKETGMSSGSDSHSTRPLKLWENGLFGMEIGRVYHLAPGLLLTIMFAWISIWLSDYIGVTLLGFQKSPISAVIVVVLLGLAIGNSIHLPGWLDQGFTFSMRKVLRLGIILMGIRLSILDVFKLGVMGVPIVLLCIVGALLFTTILNRWLRLPERLGTLIAVGTSICGVSAIVATAPGIDAQDEEVSYAVAVITVFGIVATLVYPYAAHTLFEGNAVRSGLFLGTSVHETAQVAGAGMVFSDAFALPLGLEVATVAKMVRNVFMVAVIPFMAFYYNRRRTIRGETEVKKISFVKLFPFFIIGFLAVALLRSIGDVGVDSSSKAFGIWDDATWENIYSNIKHWSNNLLVVALAGVGLKTRFRILKGLGIKPFIVGLGAALIVGVVSIITISLLGTFVTL